MTPAQEQKFKQQQAAVFQRIEGFKNLGTIPCEFTQCDCANRCQVGAKTFSLIVKPDYAIELVCRHGMEVFAKSQNITLKPC